MSQTIQATAAEQNLAYAVYRRYTKDRADARGPIHNLTSGFFALGGLAADAIVFAPIAFMAVASGNPMYYLLISGALVSGYLLSGVHGSKALKYFAYVMTPIITILGASVIGNTDVFQDIFLPIGDNEYIAGLLGYETTAKTEIDVDVAQGQVEALQKQIDQQQAHVDRLLTDGKANNDGPALQELNALNEKLQAQQRIVDEGKAVIASSPAREIAGLAATGVLGTIAAFGQYTFGAILGFFWKGPELRRQLQLADQHPEAYGSARAAEIISESWTGYGKVDLDVVGRLFAELARKTKPAAHTAG